jgi:hypothetical protein
MNITSQLNAVVKAISNIAIAIVDEDHSLKQQNVSLSDKLQV